MHVYTPAHEVEQRGVPDVVGEPTHAVDFLKAVWPAGREPHGAPLLIMQVSSALPTRCAGSHAYQRATKQAKACMELQSVTGVRQGTDRVSQQQAAVVLVDIGEAPPQQVGRDRPQHFLHHREVHVVVSELEHCQCVCPHVTCHTPLMPESRSVSRLEATLSQMNLDLHLGLSLLSQDIRMQ